MIRIADHIRALSVAKTKNPPGVPTGFKFKAYRTLVAEVDILTRRDGGDDEAGQNIHERHKGQQEED